MVERQVHGTIPFVSIVDDDKPLCSSTAKLLKLHEIVVRMFASAETFRLSSDVDRIRQPTSVAYMFSSSREASILEMPCRIPASGSIRDVQRQHPERLELTLRRPFPAQTKVQDGWKVAEGVPDSLSGAARRLTHHSEGGGRRRMPTDSANGSGRMPLVWWRRRRGEFKIIRRSPVASF
jgi:hypothetical protein